MSWSVQEDWTGGRADAETEPNGSIGRSDVTRTFNCVPLFSGATALDALSAPGLPLPNSPHPQTPILRARRRSVQQTGPTYFIVSVGYEALTADPNDPAQSPLAKPPVISYSTVTQEVEIDEDINGDPIETINGEPLVGVTRPFTDLVITVQRNLPTFNPVSISTYMNKVNSATWYGLPAGTVRIMDIQATSVFSDDFAYWDVTISFQVRRGFGPVTDAEAWYHRCAHQGYEISDGAGELDYARVDPADDFSSPPTGITVSQPVMINTADGTRLPPGTGAYVSFEVLESIDFNTLNLL